MTSIDESPPLRDPHREFRKGTWARPLLLVAVSGGLLTALFLLTTEKGNTKPPVAPVPLSARAEPESFTIGSSQAPDRIPDVPANYAPDRRADRNREPVERPSGIVPEKQFASEFKSKAAKER